MVDGQSAPEVRQLRLVVLVMLVRLLLLHLLRAVACKIRGNLQA